MPRFPRRPKLDVAASPAKTCSKISHWSGATCPPRRPSVCNRGLPQWRKRRHCDLPFCVLCVVPYLWAPRSRTAKPTAQCGIGTWTAAILDLRFCLSGVAPGSTRRSNSARVCSAPVKVERQICLVDELLTYADPVERCDGIEPTGTDVVGNAIFQIAQLFLRGLCSECRFF